MSAERFAWLDRWVAAPEDIVRTPGTESNVKEIYDACAELSRDPANVVFNQFCEFGNYLAHYLCTGTALAHVTSALQAKRPTLRPFAFVSATGSAGTLAAGDYLKESFGTRIVAVEALECPTLLYNGFGEHNIQGIGDKHVPLIHNVMKTDAVAAISDRATDALALLFNRDIGRRYLAERRGVPAETVGGARLVRLLLHLQRARRDQDRPLVRSRARRRGAHRGHRRRRDVRERVAEARAPRLPGRLRRGRRGEVFGEHLAGARTDHYAELGRRDRERIFNLGYYTWVEQQGVPSEEFSARRSPAYWERLRSYLPAWDGLIGELNRQAAAAS